MSEIAWIPRPPSLPDPSVSHLVVEASAGTGKTFFLEHRVADLVLGAGAALEQILLVTFTEKATAELRERIRALLDRLIHAVPGDAPADASPRSHWQIDATTRARLRAALWGFERAQIFTIHGFCQRVLAEEAIAGARPLAEQQIHEDVAFERAWRHLLRTRFARDPDDAELLQAFLASDGTVDGLRRLLAYAVRTGLPLHPAPRQGPLPLDRARAVRDAVVGVDDVPAFVASIGGAVNKVDKVTRVLERLVPRLRAASDDRAVLWALDAFVDDDDGGLAYLAGGALLPKKGGVAAAEVQRLRLACEALAPSLVSLRVTLAHRFVPPLAQALADGKADRGEFDYQDLLTRVRDLLGADGGGEVAARLRARLPWAMIDEFQDTDPVQWDIFRSVWADPAAPARGLTLVGDPKQAIYSFRGADVATYRRACAALVDAGAVQVDLSVNQRSTSALVEATNAVLAGPPGGGGMLADELGEARPVTAAGHVVATTPGPAIVALRVPATGRDSESRRELVFAAVADEIRRLTDARSPLSWRDRRGERTLRASDVFVLTRSNVEGDLVAQALRRRGVPCALLLAEYLLDTPEAHDVAALLEAIAQPRARARRLRAWHTAFFGLAWADAALAADAPDHHPLVAPLFAWSELARRRQFHRLFHRVLGDTGFAARALAVGRGERAIVNTRHVLELLLVELDRTPVDLAELAARLRGWIRRAQDGVAHDDSDVQRAETDAPAVRILTIHRAKGLEAAVVFVVGGHGAGGAGPPLVTATDDDGVRGNWADANATARSRRAEAEAREAERVAYVAMTRAKVRLYLPWYEDAPAATSGYAPIQRQLDRWHATGAWPAGLTVLPIAGPAPSAEPDDDDPLHGFVAPPAPEPARGHALDAQLGGAVLSYSRLAHAAASDSRRFDETPAARPVADDELPPGADTGVAVHAILERVPLTELGDDPQAWAARPEIAAIFEQACAGVVPARARTHAARLIHTTLTAPPRVPEGAPAVPAIAAATQFAREVEFAFPRRPARDGYVRGYLDAVVAWDERLWIIDYKTDVLADPTPAGARALVDARYDLQARLYALAGARLRVPGRRFAGLLYWFVRDQLVVPVPVDDASLAAWQRWLDRVPAQGALR